MFTKSDTEIMLDKEIQASLKKLTDLEKDSKEYAAILDHVVKLHKLKAEEKPKRISSDTVLMVSANLFGILAILGHEHVAPITSKALTHVIKPR